MEIFATIKSSLTAAFVFAKGLIKTALSIWGLFLLVLYVVVSLLFLARGGFFQYAPVIGRHAELWAVIIDLFQVTFAIVVDGIKAIVVAIKFILEKFGAHLKNKPTHWVKVKPISARQLRRFIDNVTITCGPFHKTGELISLAASIGVGDQLCPVLRAATPLGFVGRMLHGVLGWASPDPNPQKGNCRMPSDEGGPGIECVYLGLGPIVADVVLLPLVIILLGWLAFKAYKKSQSKKEESEIKKKE